MTRSVQRLVLSDGIWRLLLTACALLVLVVVLAVVSGCGESSEIKTPESEQSSIPVSEAKENPEKLADKLYTDPKGYFRTGFPDGWEVQEYPDDPRGKVAFICQDGSNVDLRVLVNVVEYDSVDRLIEELKSKESQLGIDTGIEDTTFDGRPAVKRNFEMQGLQVMMIDFLVGKVAHNVMYSAPPGDFDSYLPVVEKAMATYQPIGKTVGKAEAVESGVAKCLRLAELMMESGNVSLASEYVDEGLKMAPNHAKLLSIQKKITDSKSQ